MTFTTLMVNVEISPAPETDARVRLAAELAERFAAMLIGVAASVLPPYPAENGYVVTDEFYKKEYRDILAALKDAEVRFRSAASLGGHAPGLNLEWRSAVDLPETCIVAEARSADLVIVGPAREPADICRSLDPGTAILKAGRPVLLVPPGVDRLNAEHIVIGWKDCREARRAVVDALPLLHKAKSVTILDVCDHGEGPDERRTRERRADDPAQYLARHRIGARTVTEAAAAESVADQLVRFARAAGADLIVAGGYGHSRLGEWIFGGVTRDLLKSTPICCLFSN